MLIIIALLNDVKLQILFLDQINVYESKLQQQKTQLENALEKLPDHVNPTTIKLVFVASLLCTQH
jgi:hypothetical protein